MAYPWWEVRSGAIAIAPPKVGRPRRDRAKVKAARRARRAGR